MKFVLFRVVVFPPDKTFEKLFQPFFLSGQVVVSTRIQMAEQ